MIELIDYSWPWYITGPLIGAVMVLLLAWNQRFGISRNFQLIGALCGAGVLSDYFRVDWKAQRWNLFFLAGTVIGGYIAATYMNGTAAVAISDSTTTALHAMGITDAGAEYQPAALFSLSVLSSARTLTLLIAGGFLIGFGTRYAQGCTSGHAISGLSNLQLPSLIAVLGFFIGGLIMTWLILPSIIQ